MTSVMFLAMFSLTCKTNPIMQVAMSMFVKKWHRVHRGWNFELFCYFGLATYWFSLTNHSGSPVFFAPPQKTKDMISISRSERWKAILFYGKLPPTYFWFLTDSNGTNETKTSTSWDHWLTLSSVLRERPTFVEKARMTGYLHTCIKASILREK